MNRYFFSTGFFMVLKIITAMEIKQKAEKIINRSSVKGTFIASATVNQEQKTNRDILVLLKGRSQKSMAAKTDPDCSAAVYSGYGDTAYSGIGMIFRQNRPAKNEKIITTDKGIFSKTRYCFSAERSRPKKLTIATPPAIIGSSGSCWQEPYKPHEKSSITRILRYGLIIF